jgi:hypothetical protein
VTRPAEPTPTPPPAALVSLVFQWILDGHSEHHIRESLADRDPGVPADALIIEAVKRFAEAGQFQPEIMLGWCAEAYRDIYRVAREAGDVATALRAVKLLSQLAGF